MKRGFRISLFGNLLLAGAVTLLVGRKGHNETPGATQGSWSGRDETAGSATPEAQSPLEPTPFHWSQVESGDYRTYVANLRRIGCPEQTIRDIVTADLHSLYVQRREQFEQESTGGSRPVSSTPVDFTRRALELDLKELEAEEARAVLALLGSPPGQRTKAVTPAAPVSSLSWRRQRAQETEASLPLVFHEIDSTEMPLSEPQTQTIADLRERFNTELSRTGLEPWDPDYRRRWLAAKSENDSLLSGMLGIQFYLDYELAVAHRSQTP